jgi:hypothetical protein
MNRADRRCGRLQQLSVSHATTFDHTPWFQNADGKDLCGAFVATVKRVGSK